MLLRMRGADPSTTRAARSCSSASSLDPTKKGRAYSKGNRQKVALVAALAAPTSTCWCWTSRPPGWTR